MLNNLSRILSDTEGRIASILVVLNPNDRVEITPDNLENSFAGHFLKRGIEVQVVAGRKHTADVRIGGIIRMDDGRVQLPFRACIPNNFRQTSGFGDEKELVDWLWSSLPLSREFPILKKRGEPDVDSSTMPLMDRYELQQTLRRVHGEHLYFVTAPRPMWTNASGDIQVTSTDALSEEWGKMDLHDVEDTLNCFFQHVRGYWYGWDAGLDMDLNEVDRIRKVTVLSRSLQPIKGYPQDQITVRSTFPCETELSLRLKEEVDDLQFYTHFLPLASWSNEQEKLTVEGGNMFVSDNLVFIGADDRSKFEKLSRIELLSTSTLVSELVFGSPTQAKVIWIGTNENRPRHYRQEVGKQPVYHIDLFFHPIGLLDGGKKFTFLFAMPDRASIFPHYDRRWNTTVDAYVKFFEDTLKKLEEDICAADLEPDPIKIPLAVQCNARQFDVAGYSAFCNGFVEKYQGQVDYLFPCFHPEQKVVAPPIYALQQRAVALIREHNGIQVEEVIDFHMNIRSLSDAGARCKSKVIRRC